MSGFRKQPEKSDDTHEQQIGARGIDDDITLDLENPLLNLASSGSSSITQDGGMDDFYKDIFRVLSNVELHATLPEEATVVTTSGSSTILKAQNVGKGESSGKKAKSGDGERKDSKESRTNPLQRRSRSAILHNISEKIRRDRIRRKLKALQDLIPNCTTTDKASMLDEAVKYIKALQNQIQVMSAGAGAMLQTQNPLMLQAPYQRVQVPQYPSQFMPMRPGMGMYGGSPSPNLPGMPFALPNPCQSTLAGSGMAMVGPMSHLQMPLNRFQSLSSADSTLTAASASYTCFASAFCSTTHGETADFCQAPVRSQESVLSGSSALVLPSQVITPATSSSTSLLSEVPQISDENEDSGPSQRT